MPVRKEAPRSLRKVQEGLTALPTRKHMFLKTSSNQICAKHKTTHALTYESSNLPQLAPQKRATSRNVCFC